MTLDASVTLDAICVYSFFSHLFTCYLLLTITEDRVTPHEILSIKLFFLEPHHMTLDASHLIKSIKYQYHQMASHEFVTGDQSSVIFPTLNFLSH